MVPDLSTGLRSFLGVVGLVAIAVPAAIAAQSHGAVDGRVIHRGTGNPIAGVHVSTAESLVGSVTDDEGYFRLSGLQEGDRQLRFHLLSCLVGTETVHVMDGSEVSRVVHVGPPALEVAGIVVQGVRQEVPEADRSYAVGRLDPSGASSPRTLADLVRGRVPGARVVQGSGEPGSGASVQLRGPTSIQGAQDALIVVDGIVAGTSLLGIDPNDVEHIEVLKGPIAAASYGSRGQAGVLEITTRRGDSSRGVPLLLVDHKIVDGSLADLPPETIAQIELLDEQAAQLVLGPLGRDGAIHVTTMNVAPLSSDSPAPPYCVGRRR